MYWLKQRRRLWLSDLATMTVSFKRVARLLRSVYRILEMNDEEFEEWQFKPADV